MRAHNESRTARAPGWVRRVRSRVHAFVEEHRPAGRAERAQRAADSDEIDEAGRESFPASDPPPWTLGVERHERRP
jgi:hypothetical protein